MGHGHAALVLGKHSFGNWFVDNTHNDATGEGDISFSLGFFLVLLFFLFKERNEIFLGTIEGRKQISLVVSICDNQVERFMTLSYQFVIGVHIHEAFVAALGMPCHWTWAGQPCRKLLRITG